MRRALIGGAVDSTIRPASFSRLFQLKDAVPGTRRAVGFEIFLSDAAIGETKRSWINITRTGDFIHPVHGKFSITPTMLAAFVKSFEAKVFGQSIFLDVAHRPDNGAAGEIVALKVDGNKLRGLIEWTPKGLEAVMRDGYRYCSIEYHDDYKDNEKGNSHGAVMTGAGLVTRPFVKHLDRIELAEPTDGVPVFLLSELSKSILTETQKMWTIKLAALLAAFATMKLSDAIAGQLVESAKIALGNVQDDAEATKILAAYEATGKQCVEQLKSAAPGAVVMLAAPAAPQIDIGAAVAKALADLDVQKAAAAKLLADSQASRAALFATIIGADKTLSDASRAELVAEASAKLTPNLTDDNVRTLAEMMIASKNQTAIATQLQAVGYPIRGNAIISVVDDGDIKKLSGEVARRLGFDATNAAARYRNTAGVVQPGNKALADRVIAAFDAEHGATLLQEAKMLAAGKGSVSDTAVPKIYDRTVIQEALYNLVGLGLTDNGVQDFAEVWGVPFTYRDTSGAGLNAMRVYEGQAINRSGVLQTTEETRPIPQKLAIFISNEMQNLFTKAPYDFDPLAQNARQTVRMVAEDAERMIADEHVQASDEFGAVQIVAEVLTAQVQGTNRIFVLAQFPVVKPRKTFDLKGVQQGATVNPITVTLNAIVRNDYLEALAISQATGVAMAVATYYIIDWNLGELRFVDQTGAAFTPTNAWVLTVTYSYATNATKFNTDLGAQTVQQRFSDALLQFGFRKSIIEDQRFASCDFSLCSGTLRAAIEQAQDFASLQSRVGTDLSAEGNLGRIKGVPNSKIIAPGIAMGDTRLVLGESRQTRFRVAKPFSLGALQDARNAAGNFIGSKEAYGEQWVYLMTPNLLKRNFTSIVFYSVAARVARIA